jgi:hypothetical protein
MGISYTPLSRRGLPVSSSTSTRVLIARPAERVTNNWATHGKAIPNCGHPMRLPDAGALEIEGEAAPHADPQTAKTGSDQDHPRLCTISRSAHLSVLCKYRTTICWAV